VLLLAGLIVFGCFPRLLTDDIETSVKPVAQLVDDSMPAGAPVLKGVR
jgi:hypothetical protein